MDFGLYIVYHGHFYSTDWLMARELWKVSYEPRTGL